MRAKSLPLGLPVRGDAAVTGDAPPVETPLAAGAGAADGGEGIGAASRLKSLPFPFGGAIVVVLGCCFLLFDLQRPSWQVSRL